MVGPARPVIFVPSEYPPTACGGCRETHILNKHGACINCMTWYCPCCERDYEQRKKELAETMKRQSEPTTEQLQEHASIHGLGLGLSLGTTLTVFLFAPGPAISVASGLAFLVLLTLYFQSRPNPMGERKA